MAQRLGGLLHQALRNDLRLRVKAFLVRDPVDESKAVRFLAVDDFSREQHSLRGHDSGLLDQPANGHARRQQPGANLRHANARRCRGDAQVAGERQSEPGTQRVAAHFGQDDDGRRLDLLEQPRPPRAVGKQRIMTVVAEPA
jgi:hypothetical protein